MSRPGWSRVGVVGLILLAGATTAHAADRGVAPTDEAGRALNLGFEDGTLRDWTATGSAFADAVVEGDVVHARRGDMASRHEGRFWVGSYERGGDEQRGTLVSAPFRLSRGFLSFLIGGGSKPSTRAEVVRLDNGAVLATASGTDVEDMGRVSFDLSAHQGRSVFIRLIDDATEGWGHLNFDDVRLHESIVLGTQRPSRDAFAHAGLTPEAAAQAMTVPDGFRVTLFAGEPDVHQPIGMALDDRGRLWVAEAYSYPVRLPQEQAHDQILIFEDTDGDGHFDTRKVFADKLNLVSGIEVGFGGVFIGAAPEFLFLPDRDGDDHPDGPPEVLLDGWGYQDTHETLNAFNWGPDGWLYGCHGVFTRSKVGKPGTPDAERVPLNAGIWRYHPLRREFEVFAHGTSNPWGLAWDARGQAFATACVIPHLYQILPGGRYERQAGSHFNPFTFDDIKTIADHRHYVGGNPHAGSGKSGDAGGGHAHCGALIYQGGAWPAEYADSILMNNIHGARFNRDTLHPVGSGFVGKHAPDFLLSNDAWSQVIALKTGPSGEVYFLDWYDRQQCHQNNPTSHDRTNGRIFRLDYGPKPAQPRRTVDLAKQTTAELMTVLGEPNSWQAEHARRLLLERSADPATGAAADAPGFCADRTETYRLRYLWAQFAAHGGTLTAEAQSAGLSDPDAAVRGWTVRLLSEQAGPVAPALLARFAQLAASDESPRVRLELASSLQRLPLADRWPILAALGAHGEDNADANLPLMLWYALEPLAASDPERALRLAHEARIATLLPFAVRRVAALGTPAAVEAAVQTLGSIAEPDPRRAALTALVKALAGRPSVPLPPSWPGVAPKLVGDAETEALGRSLGLTFGDRAVTAQLRDLLRDAQAPVPARLGAIRDLARVRDPQTAPILRTLIQDADLGTSAIRSLASTDDPATPPCLVAAYARLSPPARRDALATLSSRATFAGALLTAVAQGQIARADLTADLLRQLRSLGDPALDQRVAEVWGISRESTGDRAKVIAAAKAKWSAPPSGNVTPDPRLGRLVFERTCAQCHNLFGAGGNIGPELTGSNRADLDYLLSNVYDPSALIGRDYQATTLALHDGRVLTGLVRGDDRDSVALQTPTETLVIPRDQIDERRLSATSMMPEGLWDNLPEREVRALIAYLASPSQVEPAPNPLDPPRR